MELAEFVLVLANTFSGRDCDIRLVKLSANIAEYISHESCISNFSTFFTDYYIAIQLSAITKIDNP
jgi:hypothetical protein